MPPACALVLAGLCLQAPYDKATNLDAMYRFSDGMTGIAQPAVVRRLGVRIEAYQSDDIREQDPTGLPRSCVGQACVVYLKTCSSDGLQCEWDWGGAPAAGGDGRITTLTVWIGATSASAMAAAMRAVSVEWWSGKGDALPVPLETLNQRSSLAYIPPCGGAVQTGCVNLFYGRVPVVPRTR